jgi:hypothetical protein
MSSAEKCRFNRIPVAIFNRMEHTPVSKKGPFVIYYMMLDGGQMRQKQHKFAERMCLFELTKCVLFWKMAMRDADAGTDG